MKVLISMVLLFSLMACGESETTDSNDKDADVGKEKVKPETKEKLNKVQDVNVDLEKTDGELDSLINSLN